MWLVWPAPARGHGDSVCAHGPGPHFGNLLQLNMSDTAIAATHAPPWQQAIMKALSETGGRQDRAARLLGISPRTLIRKLKVYENQENCSAVALSA